MGLGLMIQEDKQAKSPPGWKKTVEKMKDHDDEIDNPFALAWSMHNKGYKPNKKDAAEAFQDALLSQRVADRFVRND